MTHIGVQLHTFRHVPEDLPTVLRSVADSGFQGVEFANQIHRADTQAVASALGETGLEAIGAHVDLSRLERDFESLVEQYQAIDCSTLVVPHVPGVEFMSAERIDELAVRLTDLADRLEARGLNLVVHNTKAMHYPVVGRYLSDTLVESTAVPTGAWVHLASTATQLLPDRARGVTGFDRLLEMTRASALEFEIDVEHAVGAGKDPHRLFEAVGDRLFAVHLSDGLRTRRFPPAHRSTTLGDGYVDLDRELRAAVQHDADWVIGEVDDHPEPRKAYRSIIEAVEASYQRV